MATQWITLTDEQARLLSLLRKGKWASFTIEGLFSKSTVKSQLSKGRIKFDGATGYYHLTDKGQEAIINRKPRG